MLATFLVLPVEGARDIPGPRGGARWICFAYGALAGLALMSGSPVGAAGLALGAARAGCFG